MLNFEMSGFDELQKKLNDLTDPHGEPMKNKMLELLFENVPETIPERDKISFEDTPDGFKILLTGVSPEIAVKAQSYFDSISIGKNELTWKI